MLHSPTSTSRLPPVVAALAAALLLALGCGHSAPQINEKAAKFQAEGVRAYQKGDLDSAAGMFSLALEYDPKMAEARSGLGLVAYARGDKQTAEAHFKAALALNEELAEAHLNLGSIHFERGELEEALTRFRQALAIDPGYGAARQSVAAVLMQMGKLEDSRWELSKLTAVEPRNARAHALYARVLAMLGHIASAEAAAQKALALDPNSVDGHRARGLILERRKDFAGAADEYRAALKGDPSSVDDRVNLVKLLIAAQKLDEADIEIQSLEKLGPGRPEVSYLRAYLAVRQGDGRTGLDYARRALRLRPRYPEARMLEAEALFLLNQPEEGKEALRRFIDEAPPSMRTEIEAAKKFLQGQ